jgi:hypothetical protein
MTRQSAALRHAIEIERMAQAINDPIERLRYIQAHIPPPAKKRRLPWKWIAFCLPLLACVLPLVSDATVRYAAPSVRPVPVRPRPAPPAPGIWLVEQTASYDTYSNGLRIENELAVSGERRSYRAVDRASELHAGPLRNDPAGIVFHASENDQVAFAPEQNRELKRRGRGLLLYVRSQRAYHFVIDRFGRVYRIVMETGAANHAGHSVWADAKWAYLDLNAAFLGVAFEARSQGDAELLVPAQLRAGRILTDMLRAKYNLAPENCVTHAQVSVNPGNRRVGWHTDWGSRFPFSEVGLPLNYRIPNPSLYLFGFRSDDAYTQATNPEVWRGLELAEARVREAAAERGMTVTAYRNDLYRGYREALSAVRDGAAVERLAARPHHAKRALRASERRPSHWKRRPARG